MGSSISAESAPPLMAGNIADLNHASELVSRIAFIRVSLLEADSIGILRQSQIPSSSNAVQQDNDDLEVCSPLPPGQHTYQCLLL